MDRERRQVGVRFAEFGWSALSERAVAERRELSEVLNDACEAYAASLSSSAPPIDPPRFKPGAGEQTALELELAPTTWRALDQEAERQGVEPERIIEHAALVYLEDQSSEDTASASRQTAEPPEPAPDVRSAGSC